MDNVHHLPLTEKTQQLEKLAAQLRGGGGGGTSDGMEARVTALEEGHKAISTKLDKLVEGERKAEIDRTEIKAKLTAFEGRIEGRLTGLTDRIGAFPTAIQLVVMMLSTWAAGAAIVWAVTRAVR